MRNELKFNSEIAKSKISKIIALISKKQMTNEEISELIHINVKHCKTYINHLLQNKRIYVSGWRKKKTLQSFIYIPCYKVGCKENVPKPTPTPKSVKYKTYVERRKKDFDRQEMHLLKRRLNYAKKKIKPIRDWTTFWINTRGTNVSEIS